MAILSEEDRKLIISLLNEYSEKLLNICEQIDRQQRNFDFLWLLLAFAWTMVFYWLFSTKIITILTILTITIVSQSFVIYIYFGIQQPRLELLQRKASIISAKLEKVIRAASQAQEHTTMAGGFFSDLEVDLRLSDAEYALQHYKNLAKKRKFFGYF
ncbi:MAG: hypothetical protein EWV49_09660 [Microcystis aeruginosa Ma_QC_Ch_20071001_S25]|jgi:hypothetical protein|uniref:Uncharacterized protein n=1 Tax=Microcystis aeruginosa Ma_QC_Ch_20071001_S25D TaxID=2486250 RepID=A0A552G448_MICAE|nr:MAG: hypothetical protein EWV49_09660 [Microcystis aeruginosa Ma_QC_Ch_20071001_S25]TRU53764.1 MAG: hypothetical protein EWV57_03185 [Microcystis aeruginosa Ma_QC_Ch_20071001_S25D]TRU63956.1 MAG: hypothetical protein EWV90_07565 [Microcystis aeruginosa Ma_QC_Ch_20071001_M135]